MVWATVLSGIALLIGLIFTVATLTSDDEPVDASPAAVADATPSKVPETTPTPTPTPEEKPKPKPTPTDATSIYGKYPDAQAEFIKIVDKASDEYLEADTDLQSSEKIRARDDNLCAVVPGLEARDWVGTIHGIGANDEGKAWVEIEISPEILVMTWNNAFSDYADETLVPTDSPMFDGLVAMEPGQKVTFSGAFRPGDNTCILTSNLTDAFGATDPDFIMRFNDVKAS